MQSPCNSTQTIASVPKALAVMNLLHHASIGPFLPSALLLYSNLVQQSLFAPCLPGGIPTMSSLWLYPVHQLRHVPLWLQPGWMPSFAGSKGGTSFSPQGLSTTPSPHQGCFCDPSRPAFGKISPGIPNPIPPRCGDSISSRFSATATDLSSLPKPRAKGEPHAPRTTPLHPPAETLSGEVPELQSGPQVVCLLTTQSSTQVQHRSGTSGT